MSSASRGRVDLVAALIKAGASVERSDQEGMRALHWAARGASVACAEELLRAGADFNAKTFKGKSVLECVGSSFKEEEEEEALFRQWAKAKMASQAERAEIMESLESASERLSSSRRPGP